GKPPLILPAPVRRTPSPATPTGCRAVRSPDGTTLATTSWDNTVRLWDPNTATHLHTLTGHTKEVYGCAFSADGTTLATTSWDNTIRLWHLERAAHNL
ncbi:MAG: WD40 repeat domain-containing protein, partial [Phycisphaerales bacterium]